jgi:hypothetical protein
LLEKPLSRERLPGDPVEQVSVHLGTDRLHQITSKRIASWSVDVQDTQTRIKSQRSCCEPSFGFEYRVEVIQDRIRRISSEPG